MCKRHCGWRLFQPPLNIWNSIFDTSSRKLWTRKNLRILISRARKWWQKMWRVPFLQILSWVKVSSKLAEAVLRKRDRKTNITIMHNNSIPVETKDLNIRGKKQIKNNKILRRKWKILIITRWTCIFDWSNSWQFHNIFIFSILPLVPDYYM